MYKTILILACCLFFVSCETVVVPQQQQPVQPQPQPVIQIEVRVEREVYVRPHVRRTHVIPHYVHPAHPHRRGIEIEISR